MMAFYYFIVPQINTTQAMIDMSLSTSTSRLPEIQYNGNDSYILEVDELDTIGDRTFDGCAKFNQAQLITIEESQ